MEREELTLRPALDGPVWFGLEPPLRRRRGRRLTGDPAQGAEGRRAPEVGGGASDDLEVIGVHRPGLARSRVGSDARGPETRAGGGRETRRGGLGPARGPEETNSAAPSPLPAPRSARDPEGCRAYTTPRPSSGVGVPNRSPRTSYLDPPGNGREARGGGSDERTARGRRASDLDTDCLNSRSLPRNENTFSHPMRGRATQSGDRE